MPRDSTSAECCQPIPAWLGSGARSNAYGDVFLTGEIVTINDYPKLARLCVRSLPTLRQQSVVPSVWVP